MSPESNNKKLISLIVIIITCGLIGFSIVTIISELIKSI